MKHMEDLARKISDFHAKGGKGLAKKVAEPSDPDKEIPAASEGPETSKSPDEIHSELSTMICPDCHKQVKAMMVKHGMMKHPAESLEHGEPTESPISKKSV